MEERKFVQLKKEELAIKKYVWNSLGKGRASSIKVEYTPVGEKIIVSTNRPGLIIGSRGERIDELTAALKQRFKLENPHVEIDEIRKPEFDAHLVADKIALELEKLGNLKFKTIAYKELMRIMNAGALGAEIRLNGKLPSERAKNWRFAAGYLKKVGDSAKVVNKAKAIAITKLGVSGIKVSILAPDAKIHDRVEITEEMKNQIRKEPAEEPKKGLKTGAGKTVAKESSGEKKAKKRRKKEGVGQAGGAGKAEEAAETAEGEQ